MVENSLLLPDENVSVTQILIDVASNEINNMNVCMPGIVEKYNPTLKTVDIKPALRRKYTDGNIVELPVIPNVPIGFMQTRTSIISVPVKIGDDVLLVFSQRSIDTWKSSQGGVSVDPADIRKFDLSDAFAIPLHKPIGTGLSADTEDAIRIKNIDSLFRLYEDGKIKAENPIAQFTIAANGDFNATNATCTLNMLNNGNITITNGSGTIAIAAGGTITVTTPSGTTTMNSNGSLNLTTPSAQIDMDTAGKVEIGKSTSTRINFGAGSEPILKGTSAASIFNAHVHTDPQGGSTGAPTTSMSSALSSKVYTE